MDVRALSLYAMLPSNFRVWKMPDRSSVALCPRCHAIKTQRTKEKRALAKQKAQEVTREAENPFLRFLYTGGAQKE